MFSFIKKNADGAVSHVGTVSDDMAVDSILAGLTMVESVTVNHSDPAKGAAGTYSVSWGAEVSIPEAREEFASKFPSLSRYAHLLFKEAQKAPMP